MSDRDTLSLVDDAPVIASVRNLTKSYGGFTAVDDVSFDLRANKIYGLLGRNGAGKTTVMQMMTAQSFRSTGDITVFGQQPYENAEVLADICFVRESQTYPDDFKVRHIVENAARLLPHWDNGFADDLLREFDLPLGRKVKKLSRGMKSALGIVIGLAARAPLTFFDEPYLGLDAVSRHVFYDRLIADYAENPRTVVLSTHLIDEVADIIEHVLLVDKGRLIIDCDADDLKRSAFIVSGPSGAVEDFVAGRPVLHRDSLGAVARVSITADLTTEDRAHGSSMGLTIDAMSLQQLVIRNTTADPHAWRGAEESSSKESAS